MQVKDYSDKAKVQAFYDSLFEDEDYYGVKRFWHGWTGAFHRERLRTLKGIFHQIGVDSRTSILDIGSGTSIVGELYASNQSPKVTATDISTKVIERGRRRYPHIDFGVDDAESPSIGGEYDLVLASEIIEHLPDPSKAIRNWSNRVKRGGYLVISTPNASFERKGELHISPLRIGQVKKLFQESGLETLMILGVDLPFYRGAMAILGIDRMLMKVPQVSDKIFAMSTRFPKRLPQLAFDVFYVARKRP